MELHLAGTAIFQKESAINADISVIEYGDRSASLVEVISHMSNQAVDALGRTGSVFWKHYRYQIAGKRYVTTFWKGYLPNSIETSLPKHIVEFAMKPFEMIWRK